MKHMLIFRIYILKFSKHILLAFRKHVLILRTQIPNFSKHVLAFPKPISILQTDNNLFSKHVLTFRERYYLRYRRYRTCQQESSCIKQSEQSHGTYRIQNSARKGEMYIIFQVPPDD